MMLRRADSPPPAKELRGGTTKLTRRRPYTAEHVASILDFLDDEQLLAPSFTGPSWNRWRAVLKAAFALPMTARGHALFNEVSGGRPPPKRPVKELVCCIGRGGGKDSIASALAVFIACTADFSRLRPGEYGTVMTLATDRDQGAIAFRYIRAHFEETPLLKPLISKVDSDRILLRNGAEILVTTNNLRSPRGRSICCAIYDECAFWRGEDFANPDVEVDAAITPGLMRFPGSLKIIISSVHRRAGLLHDKFSKSFGKDDDDTLVVLGSSMMFNPTLDQTEIDRQLTLDPEKAGAEYLSQWRDDLSSFLDRQLVDAAIDTGVIVRPPMRDVTYTAFVDPSGGRSDSFTCAVGHRDAHTNQLVIDCLYERRSPFDSDAVIDEVCQQLRFYHCHTVRGDDYGADLTVAAFRRRNITYRDLKLNDADAKQGKLVRSEIYLNAVSLFTAGRVRLVDHPRLVFQLISLERRASRSSGHDTVDHPIGGHDDLANATCGCLVAMAGRPAPLILSDKVLHQIRAMPARNRFSDNALGMGRRDRFSRAR